MTNNPLSHRERAEERGQIKDNFLIVYPLILSFSRSTRSAGIKEKGRFFPNRCEIHLCCIYMSTDPLPKGEGITDFLSWTLDV
jgi:hypothetical protein